MRRIELIEAMSQLLAEADRRKNHAKGILARGLEFERAGNFQAAVDAYRQATRITSVAAEAWQALARLYKETENSELALQACMAGLRMNPRDALQHANFGQITEKQSETSPLFAEYANVVASGKDLPSTRVDIQSWCISFKAQSKSAEDDLLLSHLFLAMGNEEEAFIAARKALARDPVNADIHRTIALILELKGEPEQAAKSRAHACWLESDPSGALISLESYSATTKDPEILAMMGKCHGMMGEIDRAADCFIKACDAAPASVSLMEENIMAMERAGRVEEAVEAAQKEAARSGALFFRLKQHLLVPPVYAEQNDIDQWRERYELGLINVNEQLQLTTESQRKEAVRVLGMHTNFNLLSQGRNDVVLQSLYGRMACRIMAAAFPQFGQREISRHTTGRKIRIGFVSGSFRHHSTANITIGWLAYSDRSQFELYCYDLNPGSSDYLTKQFQEYCDVYKVAGKSLSETIETLDSDKLDVLIYPDPGLMARTIQLAALRLAPVQCASFGFPGTSGIPTIDYYLSGEWIESSEASAHYSEKLLRLPDIGVPYLRPWPPTRLRTRDEYGLPSGRFWFLAFFDAYRWLPEDDVLFAKIAAAVPDSLFVFLRSPEAQLQTRWNLRIKKAFEACGLDARDFCIFLPRMPYLDYLGLLSAGDVFLDAPARSGSNTSLEALLFGLPTVTYPGPMARMRYTYAVLQMASAMETVAGNREDYVSIAIRLAKEQSWRTYIREKLLLSHDQVFDRTASVRALEEFFRETIENKHA